MHTFSISEAYLGMLCAEGIAYGIHLVAFAACTHCWYLHRSRLLPSEPKVRWPWVVVSVLLLVAGSLHVAMTCYYNIVAFTSSDGMGNSDSVFEELSSWIDGAQVRPICLHVCCHRSTPL